MHDAAYLYDALGRRLYLTPGERDAFLRTALEYEQPVRTFCSLLYYTGCRISEALHVTPRRVDFTDQVIIVESLKNAGRACTVLYRYLPPYWTRSTWSTASEKSSVEVGDTNLISRYGPSRVPRPGGVWSR